jgi:hypothetical protein
MIGEFYAGNPAIATTFLTGTCGVVHLGDSIDAYCRNLFLKHLKFRNLSGCQLTLLTGNGELTNPGSVTGTYTQPNSGTAGPGATAGDYWLHQRDVFSVTAGATMGADSTLNSNRVYDYYVPTTAGLVYRPRGSGLFLDNADLKFSYFGYRNANGASSVKFAATDYGVTNEWATLTGQSLNGAAGMVQYQIPSTGVHNHGTNGFRLREKLTGGAVVPTGANVTGRDGFIEINGQTGQTFAVLAQAGWRALDYITTSNISVAAFATQLQLLRATIVSIKLDENAAFNGESTATYAARISTLMDNCKLANPNMQFVLFSQYDNTSGTTSANLRAIADAGKALAISRPLADTLWLDCNGHFGDTAFLLHANTPPLVDTDTVHPTTGGTPDERKMLWVVAGMNTMLEMAHAANKSGGRMLMGVN